MERFIARYWRVYSMMQTRAHKLTYAALLLSFLALACAKEVVRPADKIEAGTWGGKDAAVIVSAETAHVHIDCTFGDFSVQPTIDASGRFNVPGSYVLRAFPVQIGPSLPAQFAGIISGDHLTLQVTVNDTVAHQIVVKGPVKVRLGEDPQLGPCPICRRPQ